MKNSMLIASALIAIGAPAVAREVVVVPPRFSEHVSFADLNIGSPAGQLLLERRVRAAAARVCGLGFDVRDLGTKLARRSCFAKTLNNGLDQMQYAIASQGNGAAVDTAAATISITARK